MLGYESVWVVLVPVQLTELLFPDRRRERWLRAGGLIISGVVFVLGSFIAWFAWTRQARPNVFHVPKYTPPFSTVFLGLLAIALLIFTAYTLRRASLHSASSSRSAPQPWVVVLVVLPLGYPWCVLIAMVFAPTIVRGVRFWLPLARRDRLGHRRSFSDACLSPSVGETSIAGRSSLALFSSP
jgi:apolipoprotein N-acyltransferase